MIICFACVRQVLDFVVFYNIAPAADISPLPLHAALPFPRDVARRAGAACRRPRGGKRIGRHPPRGQRRKRGRASAAVRAGRSEEHTSELQSRQYLVCRLLLEKKKNDDGIKVIYVTCD